MNNASNIERTVMRRVRIIRVSRFFISNRAFVALVFAIALWGIGREVWVARVLENAPTNLVDLSRFYLIAFIHTDIIVQMLFVLSFVSIIYLARETARAVSSSFIPAIS